MSEAVLKSRLEALQLLEIKPTPAEVQFEPLNRRTNPDRPGPQKKKWLTIGVTCFALASILGAGFYLSDVIESATEEPESTAADAQANGIDVAQNSAPPASSGQLVAAGYIVPRRMATVSSQITGVIQSIVVSEGEKVAKGQPLAYIDDGSAAAVLDQAQARIGAAGAEISALQAQHREASLMLERKMKLVDRGFVTRASLEASQAEVSRLSAQIDQAQANRSATSAAARGALIDRGRFIIRAPFAGVIVSKNVEAGEVVSPISAGGGFARTGVVTLVDMDSLGGEVDVSEIHISRVKVGQPLTVTLDAYPNEKFRAVVTAITPTVDRARATIKVKLDLIDQDAKILPQMAIRATFLTKD